MTATDADVRPSGPCSIPTSFVEECLEAHIVTFVWACRPRRYELTGCSYVCFLFPLSATCLEHLPKARTTITARDIPTAPYQAAQWPKRVAQEADSPDLQTQMPSLVAHCVVTSAASLQVFSGSARNPHYVPRSERYRMGKGDLFFISTFADRLSYVRLNG